MKHLESVDNLLLATAEQSRETDHLTIESLGISGDTLMEIAGNGAAEIICRDFPRGSSVLLVCGKGNNAGDALVIARILLDRGYRITLLPVFGTDGLSEDADHNFGRLMTVADVMKSNRSTGDFDAEFTILTDWKSGLTPGSFDLIIDGIFGTGLQRDITSPVSDVIDRINREETPVYALDIPSGLHCDTGEILGTAFRAGKTIQFGLRKLGCYLGDGPNCAGFREFVPLPFPGIYKRDIRVRLIDESVGLSQLLDGMQANSGAITPGDVPNRKAGRRTIQDASRDRKNTLAKKTGYKSGLHKYNNGVVHVIGGSPGLTGAPLYTAWAAWSLGLGAITLIHPSAWIAAMDTLAPELIKKPTGDPGAPIFTPEHVDFVLNILRERPGVAVIGPGIGRDEQTLTFIREIIRKSEGPLIIDADGLRAIPGHEEIITRRNRPEQVILTPHPGELAMLADATSRKDIHRFRDALSLSTKLGCSVVSKGNPVIVHVPAGESGTYLTGYDTSPFARAGFGDILAGHIAAFFSKTNDPAVSCKNGLLYGYHKLNEVTSRGIRFPEPSDLT